MRLHAGSLVWSLGVLSAALALTLSAWPAYNEGWQACQGMDKERDAPREEAGRVWRTLAMQLKRSRRSKRALAPDVAAKYARLREIVRGLGSALVAYSGGVDSALLLKVATDELGERAVGALATSEAYDEQETREATQMAQSIGARLELIETHELDDPRYTANAADRCYFCKTELFDQLEPLARRLGLAHIAYGMNRDDRGDWRPGQRAARERGVVAPLDDAEMGKAEIRALAQHLGVPVWNKPAMACYSSRIPYGTAVTVEALRQIGRAERALRALGLRQVRVRHHDRIARIEIDPAEFPRLLDDTFRARVVASVRDAGYLYVTLDLAGYRTGSLNEALLRNRGAGDVAGG